MINMTNTMHVLKAPVKKFKKRGVTLLDDIIVTDISSIRTNVTTNLHVPSDIINV